MLDHEYLKTITFLGKFKVLGVQNPDIDDKKTEMCLTKLQSLMNERTPESIGFMDAAGKPGPGIISGNLIWIGNYEMCETLRNLTKENYRNCKVTASIAVAGVTLPNPVKWTGCLPPQCLNGNLDGVLPQFSDWVSDKTNGSISFNPEEWSSECSSDIKLDTGAYVAIIILGIIGILVAVGTLWHFIQPIILSFKEVDDNEELELLQCSNTELQRKQDKAKSDPLMIKIISCFALQRTIGELVSTETKPGQVLCVNGIRVISKNWIILAHCAFYMFNEISDFSYLSKLMKRRSFSMIVNAYPCVDSFFVLSGFIVTYVLLRKLRSHGIFTPVQWAVFYLHRYIRLTAPYLVMILVDGFLYRQMVEGTLELDINRASSHEMCKEYWYTYILYVNNIVPWTPKHNTSCFGGSWFIANYFQFFIVTPIFVVLLYKKPMLGVTVTAGAVISSCMLAASLTAYLNLGPTMLLGNAGNYLLLYRVPWIRVTAFLVGVLGGWFYWVFGDTMTDKARTLNAWKKFVCAAPIWVGTVATQYAVMFGLYQDMLNAIEQGINPDPSERIVSEVDSVSYQLMSRVTWSLALTTQIYLCQCGLGGVINSFLSWSGWLVMSKLTYSVYMVHVGFLGVLMSQLKHPFYIGPDFEFVVFYFGVIVVSYLGATVLYVCVEQPIAFLEGLIFKRRS